MCSPILVTGFSRSSERLCKVYLKCVLNFQNVKYCCKTIGWKPNIVLSGGQKDDVDRFNYLGSCIPLSGSCKLDEGVTGIHYFKASVASG